MLGDFNLERLAAAYSVKPLPALIFVLFSLFSQIILLNMLIAIMGDTFDRVTQNKTQMITKNRLEIILENKFLFNSQAARNNFVFKVVDEEEENSDDEWTNRF